MFHINSGSYQVEKSGDSQALRAVVETSDDGQPIPKKVSPRYSGQLFNR